MAYPPVDATDVNEPTDQRYAIYGADELRALKVYIRDHILPFIITTPSTLPPGSLIPTMAVSAPSGYVLIPGTMTANIPAIGNASSGAQLRASADTAALFEVLWLNPQTVTYNSSGVLTPKGGSAAADYAANKAISIPPIAGKALAAPIAAHTAFSSAGAETITLTAGQLPSHTHKVRSQSGAVAGELKGWPDGGNPVSSGGTFPASFNDTSHIQATGSGEAITILPPTFYPNFLISL